MKARSATVITLAVAAWLVGSTSASADPTVAATCPPDAMACIWDGQNMTGERFMITHRPCGTYFDLPRNWWDRAESMISNSTRTSVYNYRDDGQRVWIGAASSTFPSYSFGVHNNKADSYEVNC